MKHAAASLLAVSLLVASCSSTHKPAAASNPPASASAPLTLLGTEWLLVDVNGTPPLPKVQATLSFVEAGRVAGNGSCNRFTGSVTVSGDKLRVGPLASTLRMARSVPGDRLRRLRQAASLHALFRVQP